MNEICNMCNKTKRDHDDGPLGKKLYCGETNSSLFTPSGRVSVPVELLRDLWKLYNYIDFCAEDFDSVVRKYIDVFDQMEGDGK